MKFISTRIITADVNRLVDFYEMVTEVSAVWGNELFAEIPTSVGTLAIGSDKTVPLFGDGSAEPAANRSAILEFIVEDVDAEYERLRERVGEVVTEPTTMPWGNRALLFRDPDGNLVNLFTPVRTMPASSSGCEEVTVIATLPQRRRRSAARASTSPAGFDD